MARFYMFLVLIAYFITVAHWPLVPTIVTSYVIMKVWAKANNHWDTNHKGVTYH